MSKVLLINPSYQPHWSLYEPTGILTLASSLKKDGFTVKILDLNLHTQKSLNDIFKDIDMYNIRHIGISCITKQALDAYKIGNYIKKERPEKTLTYGGVHPTFVPKEPFEKGNADYVIKGAGEISYSKLLKNIDNKENVEDIEGLSYKNKSGIIASNVSKLIENLDDFPFPDYSLINIDNYNTNIHVPWYTGRTANIMTSRGCTNNCYYCSSPALYKKKVKYRSAGKIIEEIEILINQHGIKNIHFADDNFLLNRERLIEIVNYIKEKKLKFNWICLATVNSVKDNKDILNLLMETGCVGMEIGVESGEENVLKTNNKYINIEEIIEANRLLVKHKIYPIYLLMSYALGETINSPRKTIELYYILEGKTYGKDLPLETETIKANLAGHLARVSPGSAFYHIGNKEGIVLAEDRDQHCEEELGFLPNSFLNDIPVVKKKLNKNCFLEFFEKYKNNIQLYANQNFYISKQLIDNYFNNSLDELISFMYDVYYKIDGYVNLYNIANLYPFDKKTRLTKVALAISMLSIFNFIKSK